MEIYVDKTKLLTADMIPDNNFNIWNNTSDFGGNSWLSDGPITMGSRTDNFGNKVVLSNSAWQGFSQKIQCLKGETFTLSCNVLIDKKLTAPLAFYTNVKGEFDDVRDSTTNAMISDLVVGQWQRIHQTFTALRDTDLQPRWECTESHNNIYFASFMLNRGALPLPWNISLNDLKSKLGG